MTDRGAGCGKAACPVLRGAGLQLGPRAISCGTVGKPGGKQRTQTSPYRPGSARSTRNSGRPSRSGTSGFNRLRRERQDANHQGNRTRDRRSPSSCDRQSLSTLTRSSGRGFRRRTKLSVPRPLPAELPRLRRASRSEPCTHRSQPSNPRLRSCAGGFTSGDWKSSDQPPAARISTPSTVTQIF